MSKNEKNQFPEQEELMDEELLKLGVRYTDLTKAQEEQGEASVEDYTPAKENFRTGKVRSGRIGKVLTRWSSLVAADALLMFMCMADKIDLIYGLAFLAAASAFLGARVNNARV